MGHMIRCARYLILTILLGAGLALNLACGPYSLSGSALKGIKNIAIPLFDNQTTQYGIREQLTGQLTDAFVADNTLKVVNIRRADSALRGVVTKYQRECYTFDAAGNCNEYVSRIFVDVTFEDLKKKEALWEGKDIEGDGIYSATDETEDDGIKRAIDKISIEIIDKVIKGW